jgi:hypothetical protein
MRTLLLVSAAALSVSFGARAQTSLHTLTIVEQPRTSAQQLNDTVGVETRRSPAKTIVTDTLYGGAAGLLVGTGVALISGGDWGRNLGIGLGIGLVVGGIVGVFDAARSDRATPVGFSNSFKVVGGGF